MKDGVLALRKKNEGSLYFFKENLPIWSEENTPGAPFEKNGIQIAFQLLYGPADSRLADIQLLGSLRNISGAADCIKNMIKVKIFLHDSISWVNTPADRICMALLQTYLEFYNITTNYNKYD